METELSKLIDAGRQKHEAEAQAREENVKETFRNQEIERQKAIQMAFARFLHEGASFPDSLVPYITRGEINAEGEVRMTIEHPEMAKISLIYNKRKFDFMTPAIEGFGVYHHETWEDCLFAASQRHSRTKERIAKDEADAKEEKQLYDSAKRYTSLDRLIHLNQSAGRPFQGSCDYDRIQAEALASIALLLRTMLENQV